MLVEKSQWFGGSTARSGGGVWIPGNYALVEAGEADDPAESKRYLDSIVGDVVPKVRRDTFIDRGPEVMDFIREQTPVRFNWVPKYSDYLPEQPGGRSRGRSVEPVPMDARFLGDELAHLHPPYTKAPANLIVTQADFRKISLGMRTIKGPLTMLRVMLNRLVSMLRGRKMYAMGNALAIGLRQGLIDAGVPVEYGAELTDLLVEDGRVTGVTVVQDGVERTIRALARRDPGQRRLREEPRAARALPAQAHEHRLDDGRGVQHRRRPPRRDVGRCRRGADGRRLVGTDHPAPPRPVVRAGRAQPAGVDHRQLRRPAVHERGAAVRRGGARDLQGRGDRRLPRPGVDDHRPALPQPLPVRRALPATAVPGPLVQVRHDQEGRLPRGAGCRDRGAGRRAARDRRPVQRVRAAPVSTRTSTAARATTTSTTPTPP